MTKDELIQQAFKESEALKLTLHKLTQEKELYGTDLQGNAVRMFVNCSSFNDSLLNERTDDAKPKLRQK